LRKNVFGGVTQNPKHKIGSESFDRSPSLNQLTHRHPLL